jgi:toluene monooxygenase system ferredoxin subunit
VANRFHIQGASALAECGMLSVDAPGDREVLVLRTDGALKAYEDACPHLGVRLSKGLLRGGVLTCSAHRWSFDAGSGKGADPDSAKACLAALPLDLDARGEVWVDLDALPARPDDDG